jgi:ferredoxin-NADP reductase
MVDTEKRTLVITNTEVVADAVKVLTLADPLGGALPRWTAGAHIDLELTPSLVRQYSLCGDPEDEARWQVAVLRDPNSRGGSEFVHRSLAGGAMVDVRGPRNGFPLVDADHYLFVAGGIGITPILPMIRSVGAAGRDWQLHYGARRLDTMAFREDLVRHGDRVRLYPEETHGLMPIGSLLSPSRADTAVYCCGPEALLRAVEDGCAPWPHAALHVERFHAGPGAAESDRSAEPFEVHLQQSQRTLVVPPGKTILEVVEEAGVEVLSSCRTGTCGTCEIDVLDGVPDHRDSILTEAERESGDVIIICSSRSCSARLVLDL